MSAAVSQLFCRSRWPLQTWTSKLSWSRCFGFEPSDFTFHPSRHVEAVGQNVSGKSMASLGRFRMWKLWAAVNVKVSDQTRTAQMSSFMPPTCLYRVLSSMKSDMRLQIFKDQLQRSSCNFDSLVVPLDLFTFLKEGEQPNHATGVIFAFCLSKHCVAQAVACATTPAANFSPPVLCTAPMASTRRRVWRIESP